MANPFSGAFSVHFTPSQLGACVSHACSVLRPPSRAVCRDPPPACSFCTRAHAAACTARRVGFRFHTAARKEGASAAPSSQRMVRTALWSRAAWPAARASAAQVHGMCIHETLYRVCSRTHVGPVWRRGVLFVCVSSIFLALVVSVFLFLFLSLSRARAVSLSLTHTLFCLSLSFSLSLSLGCAISLNAAPFKNYPPHAATMRSSVRCFAAR